LVPARLARREWGGSGDFSKNKVAVLNVADARLPSEQEMGNIVIEVRGKQV
jgi:hypothetical protein